MVAYIQQIAKDLAARFEFPQRYELSGGRAGDTISGRVAILREELDRLDPRHFTPEARYEFTEVRRLVRDLADESRPTWSAQLQSWEAADQEQTRLAAVIGKIEGGKRQATAPVGQLQELRQAALKA